MAFITAGSVVYVWTDSVIAACCRTLGTVGGENLDTNYTSSVLTRLQWKQTGSATSAAHLVRGMDRRDHSSWGLYRRPENCHRSRYGTRSYSHSQNSPDSKVRQLRMDRKVGHHRIRCPIVQSNSAPGYGRVGSRETMRSRIRTA
jgi:hypothetical protein